MQENIVEIKFKGQRRDLFQNSKQLPISVGEHVIVEADKGVDLGRVNSMSPVLKEMAGDSKLKRIIRQTNSEDLLKYRENQNQEQKALDVCKEKQKKHNLNMKLFDCEFQFDCNKITFYFTADKRVDFRGLVKDVASVYRTRIEFRQVGARDEARQLDGYGVCGRRLCCSAWIRNFSQITTQVAKDQNLSLNPSRLAGVCGRLKCCLMYERDFYNWAVKQYPQLAKPIVTEKGEGIVSNIDIFNEKVIVLYPDDSTETYSLDYVKENVYKCDHSCGHEYGNMEQVN